MNEDIGPIEFTAGRNYNFSKLMPFFNRRFKPVTVAFLTPLLLLGSRSFVLNSRDRLLPMPADFSCGALQLPPLNFEKPPLPENRKYTAVLLKHLAGYIDGEWVAYDPEHSFENRDPSTGELLSVYSESTPRQVEQAVAAANRAYIPWSERTLRNRAAVVRRAMELLEQRKDALAEPMTREMGKILAEAKGDIQEAIDVARFSYGEADRHYGLTGHSEFAQKRVLTFLDSVGVAALITPWNFPMAIAAWNMFPGLLAGNTFVFKPSSLTPDSAVHLIEILEEAGVPAGVVNLVFGEKSVGEQLAKHPAIQMISFTGSSAVGSEVGAHAGRTFKKVLLEMGGKNAVIVMDDADISLALDGIVWGAFGTTGQRCTATSRLILHKKIAKKFIRELVKRTEQWTVGDGLDPSSQMGPLVSQAQLDRVDRYVQIGLHEDKAKLLTGGKRITGGKYDRGFFYAPTIFLGTPTMRIAREEIFGPVLTLMVVDSFDEAMALYNDTPYGLSGAIYTQNINTANIAIDRAKTGLFYVNAPSSGAEAHFPFGGIKHTGAGFHEGGPAAFHFYTNQKVVYIPYSGKLLRAQMDEDLNTADRRTPLSLRASA